MKKTIFTLTLFLAFAASAQTLKREIITTSQITRQLATNENTAGWRSALGVGSGGSSDAIATNDTRSVTLTNSILVDSTNSAGVKALNIRALGVDQFSVDDEGPRFPNLSAGGGAADTPLIGYSPVENRLFKLQGYGFNGSQQMTGSVAGLTGTGTFNTTGTAGGLSYSNYNVITIDSTADDSKGKVGGAPFSNITNAFKLVSNNTHVIIRGEWTLPTTFMGNYAIAGAQIHLQNVTNVFIEADNAILRWTGPNHGITMSNVCNITWQGLTMIGDRSSSNYLSAAFGIEGVSGDGTYGKKSLNVTFDRCKIIDWINQGISIVRTSYGCDGLVIKNCRFENIGSDTMPPAYLSPQPFGDGTCISSAMANDCWVMDNYATNCFRFFEWEPAGNVINGRRYNLHIERNHCYDLHAQGVMFTAVSDVIGIHFVAENVWIKDNYFQYADRTQTPNPGYSEAIQLNQGRNIYIEGNTITGNKHAALVLAQSGTNNLENVFVRGNVFVGTNSLSTNGSARILALSAGTTAHFENLEITDNVFENTATAIFAGARRVKITDNRFVRCMYYGYPYLLVTFNGTLPGWALVGINEELVVRNNNWDSVFAGNGSLLLMGTPQLPLKTWVENNIVPAESYYPPVQYDGTAVKASGELYINHRRDIYPYAGIAASPGSMWFDTSTGKIYTRNTAGHNDNWSTIAYDGGSFTNFFFTTNAATVAAAPVPNFDKAYSLISTNADFAFAASVSGWVGTLVQTAVVVVTNANKGSLMTVTLPATYKPQGVFNVTNNGQTVFTFFHYGNGITNCTALPLF